MHKHTKPDSKRQASIRLSPGSIVDLTFYSMNPEGYGVAHHEGKQVLVHGVFAGEMARVKITYSGRRETFAEVVKILRRSRNRLTTPPCSKVGECDGCPLILLNYASQLAWKRQLVDEEIRRFPALRETSIADVVPSPKPLAYRTSAKLAVGGKFSAPRIGIYRRNSHDVVDIGHCPLHHPLINDIVGAVREGIKKGKVPIYNPASGQGLLRYLVVRVSEAENKAMLVLVTTWRSYNEIHHLAKFVQNMVPDVLVVVQNVNASAGNVIMGQKDYFLTERRSLVESVGDVRFAISPRSFFQVNVAGARTIYEKVREWADSKGAESVLDLYCGVGGISLFLASVVREVFGIEVVDAAVADAEANAHLNGIRNCRFAAGDVAEILNEIAKEQRNFDLAVLNPPRKGCEARVLYHLAAIRPAKIIYVSCSPQTLARDLDILAGKGYRTTAIQPVDMFPQTPHVENVALLVRA